MVQPVQYKLFNCNLSHYMQRRRRPPKKIHKICEIREALFSDVQRAIPESPYETRDGGVRQEERFQHLQQRYIAVVRLIVLHARIRDNYLRRAGFRVVRKDLRNRFHKPRLHAASEIQQYLEGADIWQWWKGHGEMRFVEDYGVHMWLIRKFGGRDTPLQSRQTCVRV